MQHQAKCWYNTNIFLQHNAVVSENFEKPMQILTATRALEYTKLMKVGIFETLDSYPVHFGIIEGLVTSLCQVSKPVYSLKICIIGTCS